ncbi:MAG: S-adenosylmethionine synthase [Parcubacteria group bacterium GW2011_GWA2_52_8]|nr:MAG: S-adenosylmethionine synthase [Parcubacteria group bacterium GW2011_GWA2_52_8]
MKKLFTSESVTEGHPDKLCDQISDAILDAVLKDDPRGRVAVEALVTNGVCVVAGELTTRTYVDIPKVVRGVIRDVGYTNAEYGFQWDTSGVMVAIQEQSGDIARGVDAYTKGKGGEIVKEDLSKLGAGDQGLMFGYATSETKELMPLPIVLAHKLVKRLAQVRKNGTVKGLRPDGKSQVTVEYQNDKPKRVHTVLIAAQHDESVDEAKLKNEIERHVIRAVIPKNFLDKKTRILINSTGRFVKGGPQADTGLTGRKIIVDTYGGWSRHGGGCFSGKDPSKVDRSGSYMARYVAKNLVAAGVAKKAEVQIAYAIGVPEPLSVRVDTFGTGKIAEDAIVEIINQVFDLRPGMIIKNLNLRRPIYQQVATYGHFGRIELNLPWERIDRAKEIKKLAKIKIR